jgi:hypothetical protein
MEPTTHNKMPGPGERGGALKNGPKPQNHGLFSKKIWRVPEKIIPDKFIYDLHDQRN